MKKFMAGIAAVVLALSFSAFTVIHKPANEKAMLILTWHKYNPAGTMELSPVVSYTGTAAQAKAAFNCPDGPTVNCARGYDADGNPTSNFITKVPQ
jgi:hypothetical protein